MHADHNTVEWPDYPGNNMFNSFGNLEVDPTAALLFIDFDSGRTLQLSGRAVVDWEEARSVRRHRALGALRHRICRREQAVVRAAMSSEASGGHTVEP